LNAVTKDTPFIALIDDDGHSAHLLTRMLLAHGSPDVRHFGTAAEGEDFLADTLADAALEWPGMVVVDLKAHSGANLEFVARNQALLRQKGIPLAVMTQATDRARRQALHDAGASAVFFRQAELDAYRREAAAMVSFWARNQRLDAVGM
jgi:Response regulators consisting of a CheY-like receiver domain and a winged-helix DNA-binding domain